MCAVRIAFFFRIRTTKRIWLTFNDNETGKGHDNSGNRKHHKYYKWQSAGQYTYRHAKRNERMTGQMLNNPIEHLICMVLLQCRIN